MGEPNATARLFVGISELVQPHAEQGASQTPIDVTRDAGLLVAADGRVLASGARVQVTSSPGAAAAERTDLGGVAVVPGLVDSHTHAVFVGNRVDELARRARGETYEEILAAGGGIRRSVEGTRKASLDELVAASRPRLLAMLATGTTTCEIKSGYGLEPEVELKQLRAARALAECTPMAGVLGTALAHLVPADHGHDRDGYLDAFCHQVLDVAAREGLAAYADVFVERGAFDPDEARRLSLHAKRAGLRLKLHVDQLRDGDGARLAAELGALSADHLEHVRAEGRRALADAGTVATILPGCALFLANAPWPDGRALRQAGCEVAVATDCNPGSSHITDLTLCGAMAATACGLSLEEALWGITRGGAKALDLQDRGRLVPGERADFVALDHDDWRMLFYQPGNPPIRFVAVGGHAVNTQQAC